MIKIVVIDDEFMVVEGIRALIAREPECEVTGWAYDGISGLDVIRENMPEVEPDEQKYIKSGLVSFYNHSVHIQHLYDSDFRRLQLAFLCCYG